MSNSKYAYKAYDPRSPQLFAKEAELLVRLLPPDTIIEHFGSSAVPELGGKGVIDIYVLTQKKDLQKISALLQEQGGYEYRPRGGDARRFFFEKHNDGQLYHLHLSDLENPNYLQCIADRDYLRTHPEEKQKYDAVKREASRLALQKTSYEEQKKTYQSSKKPYVDTLNRMALDWFVQQGADGGS